MVLCLLVFCESIRVGKHLTLLGRLIQKHGMFEQMSSAVVGLQPRSDLVVAACSDLKAAVDRGDLVVVDVDPSHA